MYPQSFSNTDLVDEEPSLGKRSCSTPQWRCYAKYISSQQIILTFLPASFTGSPSVVLLGLEHILSSAALKPRCSVFVVQTFWCWRRWGWRRSLGATSARRRTTPWPPATNPRRTPCLAPTADRRGTSPASVRPTGWGWAPATGTSPPAPPRSLHAPRTRTAGRAECRRPRLGPQAQVGLQPNWCSPVKRDFIAKVTHRHTDILHTNGLKPLWENMNSSHFLDLGGVQFSEPQKADFHISFGRQLSQQSTGDGSQLKCPVYVYNCSLEQLKEQLVHPNSHQPRDVFFRYHDLTCLSCSTTRLYDQLHCLELLSAHFM